MWTGSGAARSEPSFAGRARQGGVVLLLYVGAALTIIGMAGMAVDLGTVYLSKTRLQNAIDAAALDGAKTLDNGLTVVDATLNATTTFNTNLGTLVVPVANLTIETSSTSGVGTGTAFTNGTTPARFVRVTVTNVPVRTYLINVFRSGNTMPIGGSAIAGPLPQGGKICGAIPLALCGTNNGDTNCTDGNGCYGIPLTVTGEVQLKDATNSPGNYGLVQFTGPGGHDVRESMAGGGQNCFDSGGSLNVQTGGSTGPTKGLNTRFAENTPPLDPATYPGDKVIAGGTIGYPIPTTMYAAYSALLAGHVWDNPTGREKRRVILSPIVNCATLPAGSSGSASVIGSACLFLTRDVSSGGPYGGDVFVQFIDTCRTEGGGTPTLGGPGSAIVLYQSSTSS